MADDDEVVEAGRSPEWHTLLTHLKTTVEGLLAMQCSYVWHTYGGLERISRDLEKILNHQLKMTQGLQGNELNYWNFVQSLRWLNPVMAPSIAGLNRSRAAEFNRGEHWLRDSLHNLNLSSQLVILLNSRTHRQLHYDDSAFVHQSDYVQAMIICLQAVEQNNPSLLSEINPALLCGKPVQHKRPTHVRSVSLPFQAPSVSPSTPILPDPPPHPVSPAVMIRSNSRAHDHLAPQHFSPKTKSDSPLGLSDEHARPYIEGSSVETSAKAALLRVLSQSSQSIDDTDDDNGGDYNFYSTLLKHDPLLNMHIPFSPPIKPVCPDTVRSHGVRRQSSHPTIGHQGDDGDDHEKGHVRSSSDMGVMRDGVVREEPDGCHDETEGTVDVHRKRYSTGSIQSKSGYFRHPTEGQSLMSFLSSQDFHTCAELDKENAHFSISEALIAAIEQMKWNQTVRLPSASRGGHSEEEDDSDAEIQQLKQRIRIRRRERLKEQVHSSSILYEKIDVEHGPSASQAVDMDVATATAASQSGTPSSFSSTISSVSSEECSGSSEEIHDTEITEADVREPCTPSNMSALSESGLSLSLGSLYSEADINKNNADMKRTLERQESLTRTTTHGASVSAAENVAIALLKKFTKKQLPKASELKWMVSEQDAPQAFLPLPNSYPVSPDDSENADLLKDEYQTRLRGNLEWAPPRSQIIFHIHTSAKRKVVLAKAGYRCAGCGAKVEPGYMRRYRYCEYLGKYFCPRCHTNYLLPVPARILARWDFTRYRVSNFAADLLGHIHGDALFNVEDINAGLYRRVRSLEDVRDCRLQLYHMKAFVGACRMGTSLLEELNTLPQHWTNDVHLYSMYDLHQVRDGTLPTLLRSTVNKCMQHISQCQLCQAKGFICEQCNVETDIIFPFELQKVKQCPGCRACYHNACFPAESCPKCVRIEARKQKMALAAKQRREKEDEDDSS